VIQRRNAMLAGLLSPDLSKNRGESHLSSIAVNAAYNAAKESLILVTAGAGGVPVTLPLAVNNYGKVYWIAKVDAAVGVVTVTRSGGDLIDGAATTVLTNQWDVVGVISDGITTWKTVGLGAGGGGITGWKEYRTIVVAANDSTAHGKLYADYVCDGVNDEVEINTALSVATTSGYRGITLLEGTFHIAATIDQMQSNTILEGQGDATILRLVNSHDATLKIIDLTSVDDVAIERLRIDGNRANQAAGLTRLIWLDTVDNYLITNVSLVNSRAYGIYANDAATDGRIEGNYFDNCAIQSIVMFSSSYNVISNNIVNDIEIFFQDCDFCIIDGNELHGASVETYDCDHCSISGNIISDEGDQGVEVYGSTGTVISNNVISDCTDHGIGVYAGTADSDGIVVEGNTCLDCNGWGITISANSSTVDGNTCIDNDDGGISVLSADRVIVSNNMCEGGPWPIYVYTVTGSVIDGNTFYKGLLTGMYLNAVTDTLVANNYFEANSITDGTEPHIWLYLNVDDCKFSDNVFREGGEANAPDYCIEIREATSENNMILDNDFRGGATAGSINDVGTGTQIVDTFTDAGVVRTWVKSGDVAHVWTINAIDEWYAGVDDGDADKWKLGTGAAVGANVAITVDSALDVGVGTEAPLGQLHVDQSNAAGAQPAFVLDQADIDQVLMKIIGTAEAASANRTLVAAADYATPGALVGWVQVEVQDDGNRMADADYWIPLYATPT